jgi:hypothetical protein
MAGMTSRLLRALLVSAPRAAYAVTLAWMVALPACSASRDDDGPSEQDAGAVEAVNDAAVRPPRKPVEECPADNPYCKRDASAPVVSCGNQPVDLEPVGVNVMVAVDGSASMGTHWPRIQSAIQELRATHPDSQFGLQLFWGELQGDLQQAMTKANWCGATKSNVLDVGGHTEQELLDFLGDAPPGPSYLGGLWETSPVIEPLNYYLSNASALADPRRTNYLVFITDGNDNCFGSVYTNKADKLLAYEKLAVELGKLNIRVVPIGFDAASTTNDSGFFGTVPPNTDLEVLSTLLEHGGSGLTEVPKVDDPDKLADVIAQVGQSVRNCRFSIPDALDPAVALNPFELGFAVGGEPVARDRQQREGWNFVAGNTSQIELFGAPCQAVRAKAPLEARKTCADNVCGTASIHVETKPRVVLNLFDVSASRIECADGTFNCLMLPGSAGRTSLTYWETVEHALGQSMIAPVNDDVEFGIQFFPGKAAATLSCDVASEPEVPPGQGTEITILSQMLEKLPFGLSPVVQVLENVAANPGRLVDPAVQGSVLLLSDGGDNCSGVSQEQIVARLGAAARKLFEQGVKTHVVRYGSPNGRTPEAEAQLRAIVENGGTDLSDPADPSKPAYVDAADDATLTEALANISNSLASCSFALGDLPPGADRANVNLYLNGEVVPFDSQQRKLEGWGWADPEQTNIELYGDSCTAFKSNRKTSVNIELGCAPVLLI